MTFYLAGPIYVTAVSPFVLGSLPYLATIVALVAVSASPQLLRRHAPTALGKPYFEGD